MKFLVLALCVYAVAAAPQYQPWQNQAYAQASVHPTQSVAKSSVVSGVNTVYQPEVAVVRNVPYPTVPVVQPEVVKPVFKAVGVVQNVKPVTVGVQSYQYQPEVQVQPGVKAVAVSRSQFGQAKYQEGSEYQASILRYDSEVNPDSFHYAYNTDNGINAESTGTLKQVDDAAVLVFRGFYEYPGADGTPVRVEYIADENGFQPQGNVLPVAPSVYSNSNYARSSASAQYNAPRQVVITKKF